jgi:hypothetical protein
MFNPADAISPDALLSRKQVSEALTVRGFQTAETTLATLACRGGGPLFCKYGQRVVYKWADALSWAQSRLSDPVASTSELDPEKRTTLRACHEATA